MKKKVFGCCLAGILALGIALSGCSGADTGEGKVDNLVTASADSADAAGEADEAASSSEEGVDAGISDGNEGTAEETDASSVSGSSTAESGTGNGLEAEAAEAPEDEEIEYDEGWEFATKSEIHTDSVMLYRAAPEVRKDVVIAVNAGHGCAGGSSHQTPCHPDGTAKVTGGSTGAGAVTATAINEGATLLDGTSEADAVLALARTVKQALLDAGYDVLMIRDNEDTQLDNIARTVFANNNADCHISLHYDSTDSDKGFFYIGVPENAGYRAMEPVKSHWEEHEALGSAILQGMTEAGVKISGSGRIALDLTQTSYSTVPSVDVEVGDRASDHSEAAHQILADGIVRGVEHWDEEKETNSADDTQEVISSSRE